MRPEDTIEIETIMDATISPLSMDSNGRIPQEAQKAIHAILARLALRALGTSPPGIISTSDHDE